MIEQIYPFLKEIPFTQKNFRNLSTLFNKRDIIIEEYIDNVSIKNWLDSGRIESFEDLLSSEQLLFNILKEEFPKIHPLYKNTKNIIEILEGI